MCHLLDTDAVNREQWSAALDEAVRIQELVAERVYTSRKKDYDNPFRQATFRNTDEMEAVIGTAESNSFVEQVRADTATFKKTVAAIKKRK